MDLLNEIIDKEEKEINKINERIKKIKDTILEKKNELELITGRVCKITTKGKIDLRSIKLNTEQQVVFDLIQKRKAQERKLKRTEDFEKMIKDILSKIATERNVMKNTTTIEPPKIPIERKRW